MPVLHVTNMSNVHQLITYGFMHVSFTWMEGIAFKCWEDDTHVPAQENIWNNLLDVDSMQYFD